MREWLHKHFPAIDKNVDRAGYWPAFGLLVWTIMSAIISSISSISQYGWGAIVLAAFGVVCIFALVISACLVAWRYYYPLPSQTTEVKNLYLHPDQYTHDPALEAPDKAAYFDLMGFTTQYLWPACYKQVDLQEAAIGRLYIGELATNLALRSHRNIPKSQEFWKFHDRILDGIDSSEPTIRFGALLDCIRGLERGAYKDFVAQLDELAKSGNLDYRKDPSLCAMWEDWRVSHNALVSEYDKKIRNDVQLGKLFRPLRPGRWGAPIPAS